MGVKNEAEGKAGAGNGASLRHPTELSLPACCLLGGGRVQNS